MQFSSREFRDSLSLFATGIAIATTSCGTEKIGITINSFAAVSLEPPLVLFSINRALHTYSAFMKCGGFTINVLRHDQTELSKHFARRAEDKWKDVTSLDGLHGGIIIQPCLTSFDCKLHCRHDGGDHTIFIGEVVQLLKAPDDAPLIYFRSNYHHLPSVQPNALIG